MIDRSFRQLGANCEMTSAGALAARKLRATALRLPANAGIFGRIDESGETIVGTITTTDAVMVGGTAGKLTVVSLRTR